MVAKPPPEVDWLKPWERLEVGGDPFVRELEKEIAVEHVLHGRSATAVGRHIGCDDILFVTDDPTHPLAVVHLTWLGRMEADPRWPHTTLYQSWQDWVERCLLPDHRLHIGNG
jgi:hypothetical protein